MCKIERERDRERESLTSLFIWCVCSTVSNLWCSCSTQRHSRCIKIGKTRIQSVQIYIYTTVDTDIGTAGVQSVQTRHFLIFAEMLIFRDETSCTQSSAEVFFQVGHLNHSLVSDSSRQTRLYFYYHKR